MKTLEEVQAIFKDDKYATEATGAEIIEIGEKYAKCKLVLDRRHKNAMGNTMGGVFYTLADFAFAVATNMEKMNTVTATANISFVSAVKGDILYAEAKCIKDGRRLSYYEVTITDDKGTLVTVVTFTGAKVQS